MKESSYLIRILHKINPSTDKLVYFVVINLFLGRTKHILVSTIQLILISVDRILIVSMKLNILIHLMTSSCMQTKQWMKDKI